MRKERNKEFTTLLRESTSVLLPQDRASSSGTLNERSTDVFTLCFYLLRRPFESLAGLIDHQVEDLVTFFGEDDAVVALGRDGETHAHL